MEKTFTEMTYVICHNGSGVIHPVKVAAGSKLASGQPNCEEFTDEAAWEARLAELGYDTIKLQAGKKVNMLGSNNRKTLSQAERKALRAEKREQLKKLRQGRA